VVFLSLFVTKFLLYLVYLSFELVDDHTPPLPGISELVDDHIPPLHEVECLVDELTINVPKDRGWRPSYS
jgi:hypothetical protein